MAEMGESGSVVAAGMHAFLFADLRGYTEFAARRGDRDAARLLARYRSLVRTEIARQDGAEIRTEGDSFYVVFPSVSGAARSAVAIAASAREATSADPDLPIAVGIGVHFGETVETAEGSVGSAVNLAARLASAAAANEVLVSEVVRSLLRGTTDVRTVAAGSRRLKGFAEPVPIFRAIPASGSPSVPARERPLPLRALAAAGVAVALLALVGLALAANRGPGSATPTPTPAPSEVAATATPLPTARAFVNGSMGPGSYVDRDFVPNVSLELSEDWCGNYPHFQLQYPLSGPDNLYLWSAGAAGNAVGRNVGDVCAGKNPQLNPDAGYLAMNRVEQVYVKTACQDGVTRSIGGSWDDLVDYLTTLHGTSVTNRSSDTLAGVVGVSFDLHVDAGDPCPLTGASDRAVLAFPTTIVDGGTGRARVAPVSWSEGRYLRIWVVAVSDQLVVARLGHEASTEPLDPAFLARAYRVMQSLRFFSK